MVAPGVRVFPLKGHEVTGWYVYRAMLHTGLLERAFVVGIDPGFTGKFSKAQVHEFGGFWQWTLNPHFDIRLAGNACDSGGWASKTWRSLADCNPQRPAGYPVHCASGKTHRPVRAGELRFRARF